jgi:NAD(P)-dependent dehydrogenase (short-subunit alcohol dehydrogenase family)
MWGRVILSVAVVAAALLARAAWPSRLDYTVLAGRRVLITGGGSGIGRETALLLTRSGAHVVISGRTRSKLESVCEECRKQTGASGKCHVIVADAGSLEGCQETVHEAARLLGGGLDTILSNHVAGRVAKLSEMATVQEVHDSYRKTFEPNVFGFLCLVKTGEPYLSRSPHVGSPIRPQVLQGGVDDSCCFANHISKKKKSKRARSVLFMAFRDSVYTREAKRQFIR